MTTTLAADPADRTKEWNTMQDDKVRPAHADALGQTVPVQDTFLIGGFLARYPGDPLLPPGLRINCRCWLTPGGAPTLWNQNVHRRSAAKVDDIVEEVVDDIPPGVPGTPGGPPLPKPSSPTFDVPAPEALPRRVPPTRPPLDQPLPRRVWENERRAGLHVVPSLEGHVAGTEAAEVLTAVMPVVESTALDKFRSSSSPSVNAFLAGLVIGLVISDEEETVQALTGESTPLPEGIRTFRSVTRSDLGLSSGDPLASLVGRTFTDPGFQATSLSPVQASSSGTVLLDLEVPQGTPAIYVEEDGEWEVILAPGLSITVLAVGTVQGNPSVRARVE